jgi:hypothetical protein
LWTFIIAKLGTSDDVLDLSARNRLDLLLAAKGESQIAVVRGPRSTLAKMEENLVRAGLEPPKATEMLFSKCMNAHQLTEQAPWTDICLLYLVQAYQRPKMTSKCRTRSQNQRLGVHLISMIALGRFGRKAKWLLRRKCSSTSPLSVLDAVTVVSLSPCFVIWLIISDHGSRHSIRTARAIRLHARRQDCIRKQGDHQAHAPDPALTHHRYLASRRLFSASSHPRHRAAWCLG